MWMVVGGLIAFLLAAALSSLLFRAIAYVQGNSSGDQNEATQFYLIVPLAMLLGILGTQFFTKAVGSRLKVPASR